MKQNNQCRRSFLRNTGMASMGILASSTSMLAMDPWSATNSTVRNVSCEAFVPYIGKTLRVQNDGFDQHLELVAAEKGPSCFPNSDRHPFSIQFFVPKDFQVIDGDYRVTHSELGTLSLSMRPVDFPNNGTLLEAVFG